MVASWPSGRHSSLLWYGNNYCHNKFYSTDFSGLYYKCFTIVIYYHNDSGQYYKTTITIVIDDLANSSFS